MVNTGCHNRSSHNTDTFRIYQEGLLSRRRLVFTSQQVLYECDGMHCRESTSVPLDELHISSKQRFKIDVPSGAFNAKRPGRYPLLFWQHVSEYYLRELSYPIGGLNAMQGVLRAFEDQPPKRRIHHCAGIPVIPHPVQGIAVKTPLHSYLTNLFWHHLEPGQRRQQFPIWTWAGWTGGSISSHTCVSNSSVSSVVQHDVRVRMEDGSGSLHEFYDSFLGLTALSQCQDIYFLHIRAWTMTCTVVRLSGGDLPLSKKTAGPYARFQIAEQSTGYVPFFSSASITNEHGTKRMQDEQQYLGLILPYAGHWSGFPCQEYASVLVVECK
jgi:hypothetical protein